MHRNNNMVVMVMAFILVGVLLSSLFIATNPHYYEPCKFWGSGTKESPYIISSVTDLEDLRNAVNEGYEFKDQYFIQLADIDMSQSGNWVPIGKVDQIRGFCGIYDGRGHVIRNLCIREDDAAALFINLAGTVKNLGIESGSIRGKYAAGIAVKGWQNAVIRNCYNKASVWGEERAAGLVDDYDGAVEHSLYLGEIFAGESGTSGGVASERAGRINDSYCIGCPLTASNFKGGITNSRELHSTEIDKAFLENFNKNMRESIGGRQDKFDASKRMDSTNLFYFTQKEGNLKFSHADLWDRYLPKEIRLEARRAVGSKYLAVVVLIIAIAVMRYKLRRYAFDVEIKSGEKVQEPRGNRIDYGGICLTAIFIIGGILVANTLLKPNNGDGPSIMQDFYAQEHEKLDVIICGSSMVGANIDLETLWKDYGIASYNLWSSGQPYWNTYYYLKESLKYVHPEVMVIDARPIIYDMDYSASYQQYSNTNGININCNWLEAIQVTAKQSEWIELAWGLPFYHNQFNAMSKNNFLSNINDVPAYTDKAGQIMYGRANIKDLYTGMDDNFKLHISNKQIYYLRKSIELCQQENVPVLLVATATSNRKEYEQYLDFVRIIADEYGVRLIDFNKLDEETGFTKHDLYLDNVHESMFGARKIAAWLGRYLQAVYNLQDHRNDPAYADFEAYFCKVQKRIYPSISYVPDYVQEISRNKQILLFIQNGMNSSDEQYTSFLQSMAQQGIGVEPIIPGLGNGSWLLERDNPGAEAKRLDTQNEKRISLPHGHYIEFTTADGLNFRYDGGREHHAPVGLSCVLIDNNIGELVDIVQLFSPDNERFDVRSVSPINNISRF